MTIHLSPIDSHHLNSKVTALRVSKLISKMIQVLEKDDPKVVNFKIFTMEQMR
jgi:hypothetical protein